MLQTNHVWHDRNKERVQNEHEQMESCSLENTTCFNFITIRHYDRPLIMHFQNRMTHFPGSSPMFDRCARRAYGRNRI